MSPYDDGRYTTLQNFHFGQGIAAQTSTIAARVEIERKTMMQGVTIKDWNVQVITGATFTGTGANFAGMDIAISKSLGGTGDVTPFGSATLNTNADATVLDATCTETNLVAGDDLVLSYEAGTGAPALAPRCEADVQYVEKFVGG